MEHLVPRKEPRSSCHSFGHHPPDWGPNRLSATLLSPEMIRLGGMLALHSLCPAQRVPGVGDVQTT